MNGNTALRISTVSMAIALAGFGIVACTSADTIATNKATNQTIADTREMLQAPVTITSDRTVQITAPATTVTVQAPAKTVAGPTVTKTETAQAAPAGNSQACTDALNEADEIIVADNGIMKSLISGVQLLQQGAVAALGQDYDTGTTLVQEATGEIKDATSSIQENTGRVDKYKADRETCKAGG